MDKMKQGSDKQMRQRSGSSGSNMQHTSGQRQQSGGSHLSSREMRGRSSNTHSSTRSGQHK